MARLGFKCDDCGDEHRGREPAAYVEDDDGNGLELCSGCYDDFLDG